MVKKIVFTTLMVMLIVAGWADSTVNKSIHIAAQRQVADKVNSVNGSITIGTGAVIQGDVETVNGGIDIERGCRIEGQVETVNGGIDVAADSRISGGVETVNGHVGLEPGVQVARGIETVNGPIALTSATVNGGIVTVNGGIDLREHSRVGGGILIRKSRGTSFFNWLRKAFGGHKGKITIQLQGGSVVEGGIRAEADDREVEVIVDSGSELQGPVSNVKVIKR